MNRRQHEDEVLMRVALAEAHQAMREDEVPVGAVLAHNGVIVGRAHNCMLQLGDPTAHAESLVLREGLMRLRGDVSVSQLTLVVTLEPCAMCAGGIVLSRIGRLVFGAWDDKAGMCGSIGDIVRHPRLNHRPEVQGGVLADESAHMLREFFAQRRANAGDER